MRTKPEHWDSMYQLPLQSIPWEIVDAPIELKELINNKTISPSKTLDLGSGTGNYSIYLAKRGFDVTGVEFSSKAIEIAKRRAKEADVKVKFIQGDVLALNRILNGQFDFILDYSLLHHIPITKTGEYAKQFPKLLKKGGKLLLICYSEKDEYASGKKSNRGKYGNIMYYRDVDTIKRAYKDLNELSYKQAKLGKRLQHIGHCFLFENS